METSCEFHAPAVLSQREESAALNEYETGWVSLLSLVIKIFSPIPNIVRRAISRFFEVKYEV